jgi:hypothetical protein
MSDIDRHFPDYAGTEPTLIAHPRDSLSSDGASMATLNFAPQPGVVLVEGTMPLLSSETQELLRRRLLPITRSWSRFSSWSLTW